MSFSILKSSDMIQFQMLVPPLVVPPIMSPVPLVGKGFHKVMGMPVCVQGDELPMALQSPLPYTQANFTVPGTGKIQLVLPPTHMSKVVTDGGKKVLIKGPPFQAQFIVNAPAQDVSTSVPVPDPVATKPMMVKYISMNMIYKSM